METLPSKIKRYLSTDFTNYTKRRDISMWESSLTQSLRILRDLLNPLSALRSGMRGVSGIPDGESLRWFVDSSLNSPLRRGGLVFPRRGGLFLKATSKAFRGFFTSHSLPDTYQANKPPHQAQYHHTTTPIF